MTTRHRLKSIGTDFFMACAVVGLEACGGSDSQDTPTPPIVAAVMPPAAATSTLPIPPAALPPSAPPEGTSWYMVAEEGGRYDPGAHAHVRFGTAGHWVYKEVVGAFSCNVSFFGSDPHPTVAKQCQTDSLSARSLKVKVMPIGDSVTGFYVAALWGKINSSGFGAVDFVGNAPVAYHPATGPDADNNGYGGYKASSLLRPSGTGIAGPNFLGDERDLSNWMEGQAPDIALLHFGTNDGYGDSGNLAGVLDSFTMIVAALRASNPSVRIFVAQIIPSVSSPGWDAVLNKAIPAWANRYTTRISPIVVVDQFDGFSATSMTIDGTHPNPTGANLMADRWLSAIRPYLR